MKLFRTVTRAGVLALAGLIWMAVPAAAGPLVDPSTLQPPPPPGAECRLDGQWIICQTALVEQAVNERTTSTSPAATPTRPLPMCAAASAGTTLKACW